MAGNLEENFAQSFGSKELDKLVSKLRSTSDPRKKYEYLLWLAKKLPLLPENSLKDSIKVKGCISQVYVQGELHNQKLIWKGYSDALITKGMLALLIKGLTDLTPKEAVSINPEFIEATGLKASLTPSRANGFLNIFLKMSSQAKLFL
ncbi:Sulfur acceptor protein SufE for iron-sulfur cluster assembly [Prochlorococcus sp. MIT 0601]|nr:Sulfur acceptor protein SufE for iron-sulfur cluster assembly [Prochlorococcus sp. MIT 0601]